MKNFIQWQSQHPDIQNNADDSIGPCETVDVDALAVTLPIPLGPVERYRLTLEDCCKHKRDAVQTVERDGRPEESLDNWFREDPQEEEEKGKFQSGDLKEVEDFQSVEVFDEFGDLVKSNRPYISSKPVGDDAAINDNDGWNAGDQGSEDAVVVVSQFADREYGLVDDPGQGANGSDD